MSLLLLEGKRFLITADTRGIGDAALHSLGLDVGRARTVKRGRRRRSLRALGKTPAPCRKTAFIEFPDDTPQSLVTRREAP